MGGFSLSHLLLLALILLILFGPSRLPQLGQSIGKALRGFKEGLNEMEAEAKELPPTKNAENQIHQEKKKEESKS